MMITRDNYEEYFILYMDNELGDEDRRKVELFVEENPDLQQEFGWLSQTRLSPDTSLVFNDKESLLQIPAGDTINGSNVEEWLLLYADNELTDNQKRSVEQYAASQPAVQQELALLLKTKLVGEQVIFPHKESLYRKEEKAKVVPINWKRIAIAAALLIGIATTALFLTNTTADAEGEVASVPSTPPKQVPQLRDDNTTPQQQTPKDKITVPVDVIDQNSTAIAETASQQNKEEAATPVRKDKKVISLPSSREEPVLADVKSPVNKTNDLPQPRYNPNVNKDLAQDNPIAMAEQTTKEPLTIIKENTSSSFVTPDNSQSLNNVVAAASIESDETTDAAEPGKKNKLRGFFRKVTRTFEKATNIKATDDEDRLLLGGLAIKL